MHERLNTVASTDCGDRRLLRLERLWIQHFATYEHTRDEASRANALALLIRVEEDMAFTPADSARGLAVKLRCCLAREEKEVSRRTWTPLLRSVISDLEN